MEAAEEIVRRGFERPHKSQERRQSYLAPASFNAAHLNDCQAAVVGEFLLRPAAREAGRADVLAELLKGALHPRESSGR